MSANNKINFLQSKLNTMSTVAKKRKKRVVRKRSTSLRASAPKRTVRRRKKVLSAGGGINLMLAGKQTLGGAVGGAIFTAPSLFMALPLWGKIVYGLGASMVANVMKFDHVGAGVSGAMINDIARTQFPTMLMDDGDLQDAQFVDANTLSDTGFIDDNGQAVVMDDDGLIYALNEGGDYQAIGTSEDLKEGTDMNAVTMTPLMDVYALSSTNPYNLASGY